MLLINFILYQRFKVICCMDILILDVVHLIPNFPVSNPDFPVVPGVAKELPSSYICVERCGRETFWFVIPKKPGNLGGRNPVQKFQLICLTVVCV